MAFEYLELPLKNGKRLKINYDKFYDIKDELEMFLEDETYMNNRKFAKKVMFSQEIKSNNTVEGITDDLLLIEKVIGNASSIKDEKQRKRIINLYNGYKYILTHRVIDENHLKELYSILSDGLLEKCDLIRMGNLYREDKVYILKNGRLDVEPDQGLPYDLISDYMNIYFDYVNDDNMIGKSETDYFIKSQIMHFYFVYIHPYFDVNGRTSRTMAMWYLLKNDIYPYIIFNRGINFDSSYDKTIRMCEDYSDLTKFLKYMMINTKKELEKEYVMRTLAATATRDWKALDYQILEYFISMKGDNKTVLDFNSLYNRYNDKKKAKEVFETMLLPLIEDGIICIVRETSKYMYDNQPNLLLSLNKDRLKELDKSKLTRISI